MIKMLDNLPFAVLMAVTGAVFGSLGALFLSGDSSLAGLTAFICMIGGFFGGVMTLRKRGLGPMATMKQFSDMEG
jgi:threonine/homoserine efflux transporter RhtA